jgi:hypothetical protein
LEIIGILHGGYGMVVEDEYKVQVLAISIFLLAVQSG